MYFRRFLLLLLIFAEVATADGTLTSNIRISSSVLGYDLQYRVYLPGAHEFESGLAVLFLTDGDAYIRRGRVVQVLDRLIDGGKIEPVIAVFVDARDPDNLKSNRRNQQFFCNARYLEFYSDELIPAIEENYPVGRSREQRTVMGLSFGGTNAACFGLLGYQTFSGIVMQSPANHAVKGLLPAYEQAPQLPLRIFLSTGKKNDNTAANRRFKNILSDKGYPMKYMESRKEHNWDNWRPLIDDVLLFLYESQVQEP